MMRGCSFVLAVVAGIAGCGGGDGDPDAPRDAAGDAGPDGPLTSDNLIDTGLCADPSCTTFQPGVHEYLPRWELWADTATKRRWIRLPAGAQIDTTDMDYWVFPVGTKLWKEFTRDGTRVETRLIQKLGPADDDWFYTPYIWNAEQTAAVSTPTGMVDANGTLHDVPTRPQCRTCHEQQDGRVLGFGAMQLDYTAPEGLIDLDDVVAMGWLTTPPPGTTPHYPVPGNTTEQDALGYMHANCGHCHNPTSDTFRDITNTDLRLRVGLLASAAATPTYTSTIGIAGSPPVDGATLRVAPQSLASSILYQRFEAQETPAVRMPKIGTEVVDPTGLALLAAWINGLPP